MKEGFCYFNKANSSYTSHPVEMRLRTKRPTKMHLEALEINRVNASLDLKPKKPFSF